MSVSVSASNRFVQERIARMSVHRPDKSGAPSDLFEVRDVVPEEALDVAPVTTGDVTDSTEHAGEWEILELTESVVHSDSNPPTPTASDSQPSSKDDSSPPTPTDAEGPLSDSICTVTQASYEAALGTRISDGSPSIPDPARLEQERTPPSTDDLPALLCPATHRPRSVNKPTLQQRLDASFLAIPTPEEATAYHARAQEWVEGQNAQAGPRVRFKDTFIERVRPKGVKVGMQAPPSSPSASWNEGPLEPSTREFVFPSSEENAVTPPLELKNTHHLPVVYKVIFRNLGGERAESRSCFSMFRIEISHRFRHQPVLLQPGQSLPMRAKLISPKPELIAKYGGRFALALFSAPLPAAPTSTGLAPDLPSPLRGRHHVAVLRESDVLWQNELTFVVPYTAEPAPPPPSDPSAVAPKTSPALSTAEQTAAHGQQEASAPKKALAQAKAEEPRLLQPPTIDQLLAKDSRSHLVNFQLLVFRAICLLMCLAVLVGLFGLAITGGREF